MCKNLIRIKSKNTYNIKKAFIPCGWCDECRLMQKTEWTNRLLTEMDYYQKKYKYKVGFITLTYNEQHLPHIPSKFLKDKDEKIPCFNYKDVKRLNGTLRKYLWTKYNLKNGYRYFITCEYGEKHHRPHMHGIILFNPMFTHLEFYQFIEDAWTGTTTWIQNNKKRKTERENYGIINPYEDFVPIDTHGCGAYVAKYVCKDIEYYQFTWPKIKDKLTKKEKNELRQYAPFHRQSLGLSRCILDTNDTKEIIDKLEKGIDVIGSAKKKELPRYIKERIAYTTQSTYNLKAHRHEQTKKYTKTYYENKEQIYNKKFEENKKMFERFQQEAFWEKKLENRKEEFKAKETSTQIKNIIQYYGINEITKFYTIYYGVKYENCKEGEPHEILFSRYNPIADNTDKITIDKEYYDTMNDVCGHILSHDTLEVKQQRSKQQEKQDKIKAFWTNLKQ